MRPCGCITFRKRKVVLDKENGKYVTTDNWIVTSFKKGKKVINDTIAYAATFTSNTIRSENPFTSEIIIDNVPKVKSIFEKDRSIEGTSYYYQYKLSQTNILKPKVM